CTGPPALRDVSQPPERPLCRSRIGAPRRPDPTVRPAALARRCDAEQCRRQRGPALCFLPMSPRPVVLMPQSTRRNRMMLLVFGTGATTGLHLGLVHLVLWQSWTAPIVFTLASLVFGGVTYMLWLWVFPVLGGRSFAAQLARQSAAAAPGFAVVSAIVVWAATWHSRGGIGLFGTPTGPDVHLTITPAMRQGIVRLYALLPIVPVGLMSLIGYHLVWRHVQALQTR